MKIVVLAGGNSTEREVSLCSGTMAYRALKEKGHQVVLLDVYLGVNDVDVKNVFEDSRDWSAGIGAIKEVNPDMDVIREMKHGSKMFFGEHVLEICMECDIVFMALHGANGEDGKIQATFDLLGIKYTGTDYVSSALCMDKSITKVFFEHYGVLTPKSRPIFNGQDYSQAVKEIGFPLVVKTNCGGSSVGVYIVRSEEELTGAIKEAFSFSDEALLEQYIKGRELTCGVMEGHALPIVEITPVSGFYDYKNKYQAGCTVDTCPAEVGDEVTKKVKATAETVYQILRLKTYCRVDFILDEQGNPYCLEANTLPGMTPISLLPQEANAEGMDYPSLCDHIINISMKKYCND